MIRRMLLLFLVLLLFAGCELDTKISLSGGEQGVGAEVFIDGKKIGLLEKHVHRIPESEGGRQTDRELGIKPGDIYSGTIFKIKISDGEHELTVVSKDGKRISKKIQITGKNYFHADFDKMIILD